MHGIISESFLQATVFGFAYTKVKKVTRCFSAAFSGSAMPLSTGPLAAYLVKIPFMTWKIILAIHFEALKLWLKGAKFRRSPPAPPPVSFNDRATVIEPAE